MKIGDKIIPGMFKYSDTLEYTQGDFIIYNNGIYICNPPIDSSDEVSVKGLTPPDHPECFDLYLHDQVATVDDYRKFVETGSFETKSLTLGMVKTVLDGYMFGMTGNGIITEQTSDTALSDMINSKDINYATVVVSREHPEIRYIVMSPQTEGNSEVISEAETSVILRQYAYYNKSSRMVKVQELFDHRNGQIYSRTNVAGKTSGWELISSSLSAINKRANELISTYTSRLRELDVLTESLKSNFRFRRVPGEYSALPLTLSVGSDSASLTIPSLDILLTISIKYCDPFISSTFPTIRSITINLSDLNEKSNQSYYLSNSALLSIYKTIDQDTGVTNLKFTFTGPVSQTRAADGSGSEGSDEEGGGGASTKTASVASLYYQQYYVN